MAAGLYIHIPFCKSRCLYCGFFSTTALDQREAYVERLCREMDLRQGYLAQAEGTDADHVGTIYLGGGTPSSLTDGQLRSLFAHKY